MSGYRLRKELEALATRYGYEPQPERVDLTAPVDHPMVICGIASTSDIDHERVSFAPGCFDLAAPLPPLLYDHDPDQPAGRVDHLEYDDRGHLKARVTATHETARRCGAFSIAAHIDKFELKNTDTHRFHAVVHKARLGDVSLVKIPINPNALVTNRFKALPDMTALPEFYTLMQRRVEVLIKMTKLLGEQCQCRT